MSEVGFGPRLKIARLRERIKEAKKLKKGMCFKLSDRTTLSVWPNEIHISNIGGNIKLSDEELENLSDVCLELLEEE